MKTSTIFSVLATAAMSLAVAVPNSPPPSGGSTNTGNQCSETQQSACCNSIGLLGFTCILQGLTSTCSGQTLCCENNQSGLINLGGCVLI